MKRGIFVTVILAFSHLIWAQDASLKMDDFKGPTTPAFSILDFEPSSVLRPSSPSELSANVLSSFDENGKLVPNIGIEFLPYWLKSQPSLTWKDYNDPTTWQSIVQTFALSGATVRDSATSNNRLGVGFRFQPIVGQTNANFILKSNEFFCSIAIEAVIGTIRARAMRITNLSDLKALFYSLIDAQGEINTDIRTKAKKEIEMFTTSEQDMQKILDEIESKYDTKKMAEELSELSAQRIGWVAEVSGAASFNSDQVARQQGTVGNFGLWGSLEYKTEKNTDFVFLARYIFAKGDSSSSKFDMGLSYVKTNKNVQISLEAIYRHLELEFNDLNLNNEIITRVEKKDTYRIALNAQMKVSDLFSVNLSFGKDYDKPLTKEVQFFSIIGLNYNLFSKPTLDTSKL